MGMYWMSPPNGLPLIPQKVYPIKSLTIIQSYDQILTKFPKTSMNWATTNSIFPIVNKSSIPAHVH